MIENDPLSLAIEYIPSLTITNMDELMASPSNELVGLKAESVIPYSISKPNKEGERLGGREYSFMIQIM